MNSRLGCYQQGIHAKICIEMDKGIENLGPTTHPKPHCFNNETIADVKPIFYVTHISSTVSRPMEVYSHETGKKGRQGFAFASEGKNLGRGAF